MLPVRLEDGRPFHIGKTNHYSRVVSGPGPVVESHIPSPTRTWFLPSEVRFLPSEAKMSSGVLVKDNEADELVQDNETDDDKLTIYFLVRYRSSEFQVSRR